MPNYTLSDTPAWKHLQAHYCEIKDLHMRDMFAQDADRFEHFSIRHGELLLDYSKNRFVPQTLPLLFGLARQAGLDSAIKAMFSGERINISEGRAVLHTALRRPVQQALYFDGKDVMPGVARVLDQMEVFCERVHSGDWTGYTGKPVEHIVNIGIGGSDLGSHMTIRALKPYWKPGLTPHMVANIDGSDITAALSVLNPETSLFVVASKTFSSRETMANARVARQWFLQGGAKETDIARHFVAVSTARERVRQFGIPSENMFEFWDWVGGRYSMWSAIGLPIALMVGMACFRELLAGAQQMDEHFQQTPFERNMPVVMAMLGVWYRNFFNAGSYAVLPYDHHLRMLPAYLQQADMESNGKSVSREGRRLDHHTGPVIWGKEGTNGQHAFFQAIHQGTQMIPADFVAPVNSHYYVEAGHGVHHNILLSNFIAQTEALMQGRDRQQAQQALSDQPELVPFCSFDGNRPSNSLLMDKLTPHNLGAVIALYEHKIFVQGVVWGINSFDQWGVELGKRLSAEIEPELAGAAARRKRDSSTEGLMRHIIQHRE